MAFETARSRLIFALDYPTLAEAREGAARVTGEVGVLKVGLELFTAAGPAAVKFARDLGFDVFLDLKLHDIPATVSRAVLTAGELGAKYLTVHACGGPKMLEEAQVAAEKAGVTLLAVTVLTSLDADDLGAVGVASPPSEQALRLARLARRCGIPGLVCSTAEVAALRGDLGPDAILVTPGIRAAGTAGGDDQKRVGTPAGAIQSGSSMLVVGRPIRDAADPAAAAAAITAEIERALRG